MKNWLDQWGRPNIYNPGRTNSDNGNPLLFLGQYAMMLKMQGLMTEEKRIEILNALDASKVSKGLYSRHPDPYRLTDHHDMVSHDEYNGIMYVVAATGATHIADNVVGYGKAHNWQYIDNNPGSDAFKLGFFKVLGAIWKLLRSSDIEKTREELGELGNLTYIRLPRDRAFYKIMSKNYKPSWFELLWMCVATYTSTLKDKNHINGSGRIMAWFRIKSILERGYTNPILTITNLLFQRSLIKNYGNRYMDVLFSMYFQNKKHPFHDLIRNTKY